MSNTKATRRAAAAQEPKPEVREIFLTATMHAYTLSQSRKSYLTHLADINERLTRAAGRVMEAGSYGSTISEQAGNIVQELTKLQENMRIDLFVREAGKAQTAEACLEIILPMLTETERAEVERIMGSL